MSKFTSFILGGLIGAGIALVFAPQSGEKTRALVTERANALAGEAKDFANNMPESIQGAYRSAVDQGTNFVNGAAAKVKEVTGAVADTDADELRDKIEAARKRIASQVMENAEQAKSATADVTAQAVDAVEAVGVKAEDAADEISKKASDISQGK